MSGTARKYISLLPAVNQTTALTRFFGSTVDQVFQPGAYRPINAYVGQYPSYYNSTTDFYVQEPTDERTNYQLEAGMISVDTSDVIVYSLTYPDLIGYLSGQGANVTQQSRMFENDYYVWSPPIDIDKLVNYHEYYWFGDYTGATDLPILTLTSPTMNYVGDGITTTFSLPNPISNVATSQQTIAAYVNSVPISNIIVSSHTITLPLAPLEGDQIVVTRFDDLTVAIIGATQFDLTPFIDSSLTITNLTSGMRIYVQDTARIFSGWSNDVILGNSNQSYQQAWDETYLSDESIILDQNQWDIDLNQYDTFMVDGVGQSIRLTPDVLMQRELSPQFVTIDRSSLDQNRWSLSNNWVHKDSFAWSGLVFSDRQAQRPIVEFIHDILLYNYGTHRVPSIDGVLSTTTATLNGTSQIDVSLIAGHTMGTVSVDNGIVLFPGMRLLYAPLTLTTPQLYLVGQSGSVITLTSVTQTEGDVAVILQPSGYGLAGIELYYDSGLWKLAQIWAENADPLFRLFDLDGISLDDPSRYLNSAFVGSRIFGYALGTGTIDPITLRILSYDNNGYIIFENDVVTRPAVTITNGISTEITGLYCYLTSTTNSPLSLWHRSSDFTTQDVFTIGSDGTAYYTIPLNLVANPNTDDVTFISRSEWVQHFQTEIQNQIGFTGNAFADNNWRDTLRDLTKGTQILQHVSPMLKLMLLASETNFDYFSAVRFADQEYNLFRNKFARQLTILDQNGSVATTTTSEQWVAIVLAKLKIAKTSSFPFALSTMGSGQYFIPATPAFLGVLPSYQPMLIVDDTYPVPVNMIRGHDGSLTPAFNDWRDDIFVALEQQIYNSIPSHIRSFERPVFDISYYLSGRFCPSGTGAFQSFTSTYPAVSYKLGEYQGILAPIFERWSQIAQFDYRTNGIYDPNNPFTWNYRGIADKFGSALPGHWKAIYRWYYDTVRPHSAPWEMLGFTDMPDWWIGVYGSAPYLASNTALWNDLEAGNIQQGSRAGINLRYARPGLSTVIPVDNSGTLLDPVSIGIVQSPIAALASRNWVNGDGGPVEDIWINSPSYRYALAQLAFLAKPARLVEMTWDSVNYGLSASGDQWIDFRTLQRPSNTNYVHGEIGADDVTLTTIYGIQQWISDYLISMSMSPTTLGNAVRGLDVRLIHRMASFVTSDNLSVVADNFGILPTEDAQVVLYTSPSTQNEVYSGVVIEKIDGGYRVVGYDARNPYFNMIPPDTNGPKGIITLATTPEPVVLNWAPNTYYRLSQLVTYLGTTYSALAQHISGAKFEASYWEVSSVTYPQAPRVIKYANGLLNTIQSVSYGSELQTVQQVADFLLGYERWLVSRGWTFLVTGSDGVLQDWSMAVSEFLEWNQVNWATGTVIALSPGAEELHFEAATGSVVNVEDNNTGFFGLLDRSGAPIPNSNVLLSRLDGDLSLIGNNADIFAARIRIIYIEHALIFSNITIFNDAVYLPIYNLRQSRLKLLCNQTTNWVGRLNAPGFIVEGNTLVPDFDRNVQDIQEMYDIEKSLRKEFTDYARHIIGYQARDYLQNLLLAEVEQFEFYQGMIQQKGAPGVFEKLLRSTRVSANSNIVFLEEFAIRNSRFGGTLEPRVTFQLQQSTVVRNPQFIQLGVFQQSMPDPTWIVMTPNDTRWLDKPTPNQSFFPLLPPPNPYNLKPNNIPTAGPVRVTDVQYNFFYTYDMAPYYTNSVNSGIDVFLTTERVWIYDDPNSRSWNVFEVFELGNTVNYIINSVTTTQDSTVQGLRLFFEYAHGLTTLDEGKNIVIDGLAYTNPEIQGIQTIENVNTVANWIEINFSASQGFDFSNTATNMNRSPPNTRIFQSIRFPNQAAWLSSPLQFANNDMVWIDNDVDYNNQWTVYTITNGTWLISRNQPPHLDPNAIVESMVYDTSTQINSSQQIIVNEPILDDLTIIDPLVGFFPGAAMEEIDFQTEFDPAKYSASLVYNVVPDVWGDNQVGRVWWDLSTVRYLDPYTDTIGVNDTRNFAEINYRTNYWATIAPGTSVDVYEWVKSNVSPQQYITLVTSNTVGYTGTVYNSETPSYVELTEYDSSFGKDITYYYFWVSGLTTVPNVPFRKNSVSDVAVLLQNPTAQDVPWFAPIMQDGMLVSGLMPYLNDTSTVLKVQIHTATLDAGHDQWMLMRPNDETSLPPDWLWRRLVNGLSAFDEAVNPLPSPTLSPSRAVGLLENQNVFVIDKFVAGDRVGLLAARESFVGIVNNIFAQTPVIIDRSLGVPSLSRSTIINPYLIWNRPDDSYVIEPPPSNEWDYQVYNITERNKLLFRPEFLAAIQNNTVLRVLINGTTQSTPQWSIWWLNPTVALETINNNSSLSIIEALYNAADDIYSLAPSYEISVSSYADRNALTTLSIGNRVYVETDETNENFWVVYLYNPEDTNADSYGFIVHRVQSYRTSDFYSIVDWYYQDFNNGLQTLTFSANNPPQVSYPDTTTRDAVETSSPANVFVAIVNPTTNVWYWQYFANGTWTTVAQQNATISLSGNFFNPTLDVHAVNTIETSTIANRDGSWELKVLADSMRKNGILLNLEINEIFFSMVHFIHTQQDDVDWVFKTSFMTISGYSVPLEQTAILVDDVTDSLIDYVNEVKPYHVKIRDYTTQYTPDIDISNIHVTDFDKPVYFDNTINAYRTLDPTNSSDLAIIQNNLPWQEWYNNYTLPMIENTTTGYWSNPVRHFNMTMLFDRVTNVDQSWDENDWDDISAWDGNESGYNSAIDRINDFYTPFTGMLPASDIPILMNQLFPYPSIPILGNDIANASYDIEYDGNATNSVSTINPNSSTGVDPAYGRFDSNRVPTDAFVDPNHPEERIAMLSDDGLILTISSNGTPGAVEQQTKLYNMYGVENAVLPFSDIAQSNDAILVYLDGLRAMQGDDYIIDYLGKKITLFAQANRAIIHTIGFGGNCGITESHFLSYNGNIQLENSTISNNVQVIVDGILQNSGYNVVNNSVNFTTAPAVNTDVAVIVWDSQSNNATTLKSQIIDFTGNVSYQLKNPDLQTLPEHAGTIVEVNGLRLTPPLTYYGKITETNRILTVDFDISSNTVVDLLIDGTYYSNVVIPRWTQITTNGTPTGNPFNLITDSANPPSTTVPGLFVLFDRSLVATDPNFVSNELVAVFYEDAYVQYTVSGNTITFANSVIANASSAIITTFSNADMLGIKLHTYFATINSEYVISTPYSNQYSMVSLNGKMLAPEVDYDFAQVSEGFGEDQFGVDPFGEQYNATIMTIPLDPSLTLNVVQKQPVVATIFTARPAHKLRTWRTSTTTSAIVRMEQSLQTGGWDDNYFDSPFSTYDSYTDILYDYPRFGNTAFPVMVYQMDGKYEYIYETVKNTGVLAADLTTNATSISINLGLDNLSPKLWPITLIPVTDNGATTWQWSGNVFPVPDVANHVPGVVWVGNERVEYLAMDYSPSSYNSYPTTLIAPTVTLSNLRRGTRGTSSESENRITGIFPCNGSQTQFVLHVSGIVDLQVLQSNATTSDWQNYFLSVSNNSSSAITISEETSRYFPSGNDYAITGSPTVVTMAVPPPNGSYLTIGVTISTNHPVGTAVLDGVSVFEPEQYTIYGLSRLGYPLQRFI
jgi:hypothetical protein